MLNTFRVLLCPSSGARDYMCVITAYGVQCLVLVAWGEVQAAGYASRKGDVAWWWAQQCPKHVEHIISAITHSVAYSWFFFSTHMQWCTDKRTSSSNTTECRLAFHCRNRNATYILQDLIGKCKALLFLPMTKNSKTRLMGHKTLCQQGWPFILPPGLAFTFHFIRRTSRNAYQMCLLFLWYPDTFLPFKTITCWNPGFHDIKCKFQAIC